MSGVNDPKFNDAERKKIENEILFLISLSLFILELYLLKIEKLIQKNQNEKELFEALEQKRQTDELRRLQILDEDEIWHLKQLQLIVDAALQREKELAAMYKQFLQKLIDELDRAIESLLSEISDLRKEGEFLREKMACTAELHFVAVSEHPESHAMVQAISVPEWSSEDAKYVFPKTQLHISVREIALHLANVIPSEILAHVSDEAYLLQQRIEAQTHHFVKGKIRSYYEGIIPIESGYRLTEEKKTERQHTVTEATLAATNSGSYKNEIRSLIARENIAREKQPTLSELRTAENTARETAVKIKSLKDRLAERTKTRDNLVRHEGERTGVKENYLIQSSQLKQDRIFDPAINLFKKGSNDRKFRGPDSAPEQGPPNVKH